LGEAVGLLCAEGVRGSVSYWLPAWKVLVAFVSLSPWRITMKCW
jgi:hypothetical protein